MPGIEAWLAILVVCLRADNIRPLDLTSLDTTDIAWWGQIIRAVRIITCLSLINAANTALVTLDPDRYVGALIIAAAFAALEVVVRVHLIRRQERDLHAWN